MAGTTGVEDIPDQDQVSRAFFTLPPELDPESHFPFRYDKVADERAESVYWRKYAPILNDLHSRGCRLEQLKNERARTHGNPSTKYTGARTAVVGAIRSVKSQRGHTLTVIHFPWNGDDCHTHIAIESAAGVKVEKVRSNDIRELVGMLFKYFGELAPHDCQSNTVASLTSAG